MPSGFARETRGDAKLGKAQRGIEKQLDRVITRLAMDVHGARKIRRARLVEEVVPGEPAVGARDRNELAGARVIEADLHACRPRRARARRRAALAAAPSPLQPSPVSRHVDVRDLMIGDGERLARRRRRAAPARAPRGREASPASRSARLMWTGPVHRSDAVLGQHDHAIAVALGRVDQLAAQRVDLRDIRRGSRGCAGPRRCRL